MSFLDRLRPKWKHPDPTIRQLAVAGLSDQSIVELVADSDPDEAVRLAAIKALKDQETLARYAVNSGPLALAAAARLTEPRQFVRVALAGQSSAARSLAVERITDTHTLHWISACDTDAWVRLKARVRCIAPDPARDFIKHTLSILPVAQPVVGSQADFSGTLDTICGDLLRDTRFRINGGLEPGEPADVSPAAGGASTRANPNHGFAHFVAVKRRETGEPDEAATSNGFFEIKVWRAARDGFCGWLEEKRLVMARDAAAWGRFTSGDRPGQPGVRAGFVSQFAN